MAHAIGFYQDTREGERVTLDFAPGDDLVFQIESGFGLFRILAVGEKEHGTIWHLLAYEELFPDVETAEMALSGGIALEGRATHFAVTNRGLEKTPAARISNHPLTDGERAMLRLWTDENRQIFDRSVQSVLGLR